MIWWTDCRSSHPCSHCMEPISFKREQPCVCLYTLISMTKWTELLVLLSIVSSLPTSTSSLSTFDLGILTFILMTPPIQTWILQYTSRSLICSLRLYPPSWDTYSHDQPKPYHTLTNTSHPFSFLSLQPQLQWFHKALRTILLNIDPTWLLTTLHPSGIFIPCLSSWVIDLSMVSHYSHISYIPQILLPCRLANKTQLNMVFHLYCSCTRAGDCGEKNMTQMFWQVFKSRMTDFK